MKAMEIHEPTTETQWRQYYDLRRSVLGTLEGGHPAGSEKDTLEEDSYHLMAVEADQCIGVGRVHFNHSAEGQIRYMAVDTDCRKQGVGLAILEALEIYLLRNATASVTLNANREAVGFYQKHGYEIIESEQVLSENIECVKMCKRLMR